MIERRRRKLIYLYLSISSEGASVGGIESRYPPQLSPSISSNAQSPPTQQAHKFKTPIHKRGGGKQEKKAPRNKHRKKTSKKKKHLVSCMLGVGA